MKRYKQWQICMAKIEDGNIEDAIDHARKIAPKLNVPQELIERIFAVNLKSACQKIDDKMEECIQRAKDENAKALCLWYSLDNGWDSTIYICKDYSHDNNQWITGTRSWINIGKIRGFSGFYKKEAESAFFADDISSGIVLLLMLRTTIAFYNIAQKYKNCGLKICISCTESDFVRVL
jgi:hypothetical protein